MKLRDILAADDTHGVTIHCARCNRGVSMTVDMLIAVYGPDREEPRAATKFTCGDCCKPATDFTWVLKTRLQTDWTRLRFGDPSKGRVRQQ